MKATSITGREIRIIGSIILTHKSTYKEKYFIVATSPTMAQGRPRLYFTSEVNGMTQKKAAKLPFYLGLMDNLSIPADIDSRYI